MSRYRRLIFGLIVVAVAAAATVWRPWQKPLPPATLDAPSLDVLNPAKLVTFVVAKPGGDSCTVTISGQYGGALNRSTFKLSAGEVRSAAARVPGPFTVETVSVERDGKTSRQKLNLTIPGGQAREILINADNSVEVRPG